MIDAKTVKRQPYSPRVGDPTGEAAGFGKLWVINQAAPSLVPIGLKSHRQEGRRSPCPPRAWRSRSPRRPARCGSASAATRACCCASTPSNRAQPAKTIELPDGLQNIAVGGGAVWIIARRANTVTRLDIASGDQRSIFVGEKPFGIAYGRGAVWVTNNGDDTVTRIDSGSLNTRQIPVGRGPKGIAVGAGAVWVANSIASTITRIDPETSQPVGAADLGRAQPVRRRHAWATTSGSRAPATRKVQRLTPCVADAG